MNRMIEERRWLVSKKITITVPEDVAMDLEELARERGCTEEEVALDAMKRRAVILRMNKLRAKMIPHAQKMGIFTPTRMSSTEFHDEVVVMIRISLISAELSIQGASKRLVDHLVANHNLVLSEAIIEEFGRTLRVKVQL